MADFVIKQGSTRPTLVATLTYSDGSAVDLTGALSVKFVLRSMTATNPWINATATVTSITAPAVVTYTWTALDSSIVCAVSMSRLS